MVWGSFIGCRLCCLIINGTLPTFKHQEMLKHSPILKIPINRRERKKFFFQQDNENFHSAKTTVLYLCNHFSSVIEWSALSVKKKKKKLHRKCLRKESKRYVH